MLRKVLILIMVMLPITCMATAGFAERYNEQMYFAEKLAPFVGLLFLLVADSMIFYFKKQNLFWKFLLFYSLIFIFIGGEWFFQILFILVCGYILYYGAMIIIILWLIHLISKRKWNPYKILFKYWLSLICFILSLVAYDYGCDYLKQTYPFINEKFKWVDPDYINQRE